MLGQVNLGTNDLDRAEIFYTAFLQLVEGALLYKTDRAVIYSTGEGGARLAINTPYDGGLATAGNGAMATFFTSGKAQLDELYAKAIALGASCEGKPGDRLGGVVYAAYFRDLDGNKIGLIYLPNS